MIALHAWLVRLADLLYPERAGIEAAAPVVVVSSSQCLEQRLDAVRASIEEFKSSAAAKAP